MTNDSFYRIAVEDRYRVLRRALVIAQSRPDWGLRLDQSAAIRAEIRALVRVRWFVRRAGRMVPDPITAAKARNDRDFHTWQAYGPLTEPELIAGYGIEDREGQPEFNGAFR